MLRIVSRMTLEQLTAQEQKRSLNFPSRDEQGRFFIATKEDWQVRERAFVVIHKKYDIEKKTIY